MEIRKLRQAEYPYLQEFLAKFWKPNHALVKSKDLLDFQHRQKGAYNYYACIEGDTIWSLLGFIPTCLYDSDIHSFDAWGAIWKTREDCPYPGVGSMLMRKLLMNEGKDSLAGIGISRDAKILDQLFGMTVSYLSHYYILNDNCPIFKVCRNVHNMQNAPAGTSKIRIETTVSLNPSETVECSYYPHKTMEYLINRYQNHPIYRYSFWKIYEGDELKSIWVVRRITVNDSSIMRIVDMLGDIEKIGNMYKQIQDKLVQETCEYLDCLNYGISSSTFFSLGFSLHDITSADSIIPNYFEPFELRNVEIEIAYKTNSGRYIAFKGDADQDRPNII